MVLIFFFFCFCSGEPGTGQRFAVEYGRDVRRAPAYPRLRITRRGGRLIVDTGAAQPLVVETAERRIFRQGEALALAVNPEALLALER